jgi:uncharacterized protein YbjT (DUF2867 family)
MDTILVTGGSGHLGRDIVARLASQGHRVRILARNPGPDTGPAVEWVKGDLATGAGVEQAVAGVDTVVHAATHSPAAQRGALRPGDFFGSPTDVDIDGTRRLQEAAGAAGVTHLLHISIVGVQQSRLPYSRVKAAAEDLVSAGTVPWSIVPATGFYWLLGRMFDHMANRRWWPLPSNLAMQPCDASDFAEYVVDCLGDGPRGRREDFGGPQILTMVELARAYQAARGVRRRILGLPLPGFALRAAGPQTCPQGRHGPTSWDEWLDAEVAHQLGRR